jgi:hypothetical protein
VAAAVVDRFEMIEVEGEHAHRRHAAAIARHEDAGGLEKPSAVQQTRERVGCRRNFVNVDSAIFRQDQHNESRTNDVEQDLDCEHHDPTARKAVGGVAVGRNRRQRYRDEKDGAMQHRNKDGRPVPDQRFAPLAP